MSFVTIQMSGFDIHFLTFEKCQHTVNRFVTVNVFNSLAFEFLFKSLAFRAIAFAVIFCRFCISGDDAFEVTQDDSAW